MKKTDITHATIVPLIGGEVIGAMNALDGKLPEYVLSYSPFGNNDSHFIDYLRKKRAWKGEYVILDEDGSENWKPKKRVDVISTTCPCAGLSSLSVSSGAESATNDWMYTTAEHVLGKLKPKVFWGENAPRLFTKKGKPVADKLHKIAEENGYSLSLYYTESRLHGLAQKRPRTFYFFTEGPNTPVFPWFDKDPEDISEILKMPIDKDDPMNIPCNDDDPKDSPWVAYCLHATNSKTIKEFYDKIDSSTNCIVKSDGGFGETLNEVADWMDTQGYTKVATRARAMQKKRDDGKGYWAHGVTVPKGVIPSLIGAMPHALINPFTEKFLTIRDCLRIMKLPEDFNLAGDNPKSKINHICQNVPATTAQDMMSNIVSYLTGELTCIPSNYTKQNNKNQKIENSFRDEELVSDTSELSAYF